MTIVFASSVLSLALGGVDRSSFLQTLASTVLSSNIQLPVQDCSGGAYCVRLRVDGDHNSFRVYRAAVDTGSPYLVLSGGERGLNKKSSSKLDLSNSEYAATEEVYGSESGFLQWKRGRVRFDSKPRLDDTTLLAIMDDSLEVEAGGTLVGLVKHPNPPRQLEYYRPTWLEQVRFKDGSSVRSFSINNKSLTLSNTSLLNRNNPTIPLIDLRPLGDFIQHYAFKVDNLQFDGISVSSKDFGGRPIVAVLDTGLTGCLLTQPFYNALEDTRLDPRKVRLLTISAAASTLSGKQVQFQSGRRGFNTLFYVVPISLDWFKDESKAPHVIVLGQTFLSQGTLTVDTVSQLASFELSPG